MQLKYILKLSIFKTKINILRSQVTQLEQDNHNLQKIAADKENTCTRLRNAWKESEQKYKYYQNEANMWRKKYGTAMYEKNEALKKLNKLNSNNNSEVRKNVNRVVNDKFFPSDLDCLNNQIFFYKIS